MMRGRSGEGNDRGAKQGRRVTIKQVFLEGKSSSGFFSAASSTPSDAQASRSKAREKRMRKPLIADNVRGGTADPQKSKEGKPSTLKGFFHRSSRV